jgi:amino acid transporter
MALHSLCKLGMDRHTLHADELSEMSATIFPFLGADGAIHMAEEVRDARRNVSKALMVSVTINGVLGFATMIAILFTVSLYRPAPCPHSRTNSLEASVTSMS